MIDGIAHLDGEEVAVVRRRLWTGHEAFVEVFPPDAVYRSYKLGDCVWRRNEGFGG